jgi:hypothetical protein
MPVGFATASRFVSPQYDNFFEKPAIISSVAMLSHEALTFLL